MDGGGGHSGRAHARGAQLTVADSGSGMDDTTRKRVFEPFATTRPEVGTGLGLSTVFGTVSRWGASVDVDGSPARVHGSRSSYRFGRTGTRTWLEMWRLGETKDPGGAV